MEMNSGREREEDNTACPPMVGVTTAQSGILNQWLRRGSRIVAPIGGPASDFPRIGEPRGTQARKPVDSARGRCR